MLLHFEEKEMKDLNPSNCENNLNTTSLCFEIEILKLKRKKKWLTSEGVPKMFA